ncbi:hypothetical protein DL546_001157 [Coniochaeta pulveracea]|uniref:Uncharacterized protein n=1 Tax=Coniochaeta pulveracea TaxID=177199 RepID=A0A420YKN3_9PEZI|nr:hypothetical protein DL546_001157 [Coniochaeta pulveracea]
MSSGLYNTSMPSLVSSFIAFSALLVGLNHGAPNLVERNGCNADNALRALRATQRAPLATTFCRAYIDIPTVTVTVTATPSVALERLGRRSSVPVPDFMSQYPASRISSACSCLSLPPATTTQTVYPPKPTSFYLKAISGSHKGQYLASQLADATDSNLIYTSKIGQAVIFSIGPDDSTLQYTESDLPSGIPTVFIAYLNPGRQQEQLFFASQETLDALGPTGGYSPGFGLADDLTLMAVNGQDPQGLNPTVFETCGDLVWLGLSVGSDMGVPCEAVTFVAVAAV